MNNNSQKILLRVTQNDSTFTSLTLVGNNIQGAAKFYSDNSDDYSTLGAAIANNTQLEKLTVWLYDDLPLGVADREFYDGLKRNTSIHKLTLFGIDDHNNNIAGGVGQEILKVYQENNSHRLTYLIINANLQSGGDRVIVDTLRICRNLQQVSLNNCNITDEQLLPIVDAIRGHGTGISMLEELNLGDNRIGNAGCDAIATLLTDLNCSIHVLGLGRNAIGNEGATTIANSLINNNKLQHLYLYGNPIDQIIQEVFSNVLCNVSNINTLHSSNHTLKMLDLGEQPLSQQLASLLELNTHTNKSHVVTKKILKYHPNIDMEPFFEWDAEGEFTLKALPHIINWFERARIAVAADEGDSRSSSDESNNEEDEEYGTKGRKLNAIFQFAKAMPLLFEGISLI